MNASKGLFGLEIRKFLHPEGVRALEQAYQGSDHSRKAVWVQEVFGLCSQAYGVILEDRAVQAQELDKMTLMSHF